MKSHWWVGAAILLLLTATHTVPTRAQGNRSVAVFPPSLQPARGNNQELAMIRRIYESPGFQSKDWRHPTSLRWPGTYYVAPGAMSRRLAVLQSQFSGNQALLLTEFHDSAIGVQPATLDSAMFEAIDTYRDWWVKQNGNWVLRSTVRLASTYLVNGRPPEAPTLQEQLQVLRQSGQFRSGTRTRR